jgi:hypothetical protein
MSITARDFVVFCCCMVYEHYSLRAFWKVMRAWRGVLEKRRQIMARKRVSDEYMAGWFHYEPVSRPGPKKAAAAMASARGRTQIAES